MTTDPHKQPARGPRSGRPGSPRPLWRRLWPLGVLAAIMTVAYASGFHERLTLDTVIRRREELAAYVDENVLVATATYLAMYALAVAISFPGASFLTILGGFLYGVTLGTVLTTVAATAGASVIFLVARTSVGSFLRERAGPFARRFVEGFEENAFSYLLFLRLVPLFPFWLINVVPALFRVSLPTYVTATAIGIVPGTIVYSLLGDGLNGLIAAQEEANPGCAAEGTCEIDFAALVTPKMIIAMVGLALVALIPVAVRTWRARKVPA